jgi:hypothetical protein
MKKYLPILFVLTFTLNGFVFAQDAEEETPEVQLWRHF